MYWLKWVMLTITTLCKCNTYEYHCLFIIKLYIFCAKCTVYDILNWSCYFCNEYLHLINKIKRIFASCVFNLCLLLSLILMKSMLQYTCEVCLGACLTEKHSGSANQALPSNYAWGNPAESGCSRRFSPVLSSS